MIGVNLSGGEFGGTRGVYGTDYIYPDASHLDYYASRGVELVRLPFRWEHMQPTLGGALDPAELGRVRHFLDLAEARGIQVVLDLHNYARYDGRVLGTDQLPTSALVDFWTRLAGELRDEPAVYGYGIMNEPHDLASGVWPRAAQGVVNAIRSVDAGTTIIVGGEGWSNPTYWANNNRNLRVSDPSNNILYEAHVYFDRDNGGNYRGSYDEEGAYPNLGIERMQSFLNWLAETGSRGYIGEFGVPDNDPRWLEVMDRFLAAVNREGMPATAWGGGPRWGNYALSLEPRNGVDRPQMALLQRYAEASSGDGGGAPDPVLRGGPGDDEMYGSSGADVMAGNGGNDTIRSGAGNDSVEGGAGDDTLLGGAGNDSLSGQEGNDRIKGEEGDDVLSGGPGADLLEGGGGADTLSGDDGDDVLGGQDGNDRLFGGAGRDRLYGDEGNDSLDGGADDDELSGWTGDDLIAGGAGNDILSGDDGADTLGGQDGNDVVNGGLGRDRLYGDAGDDTVRGGEGDDHIEGGTGQDRLYGDAGNDVIGGQDGNDHIEGGSGNDQLWGDAGDDVIGGQDGDDYIAGQAGNDRLWGDAGNDTIGGGDGADRVEGGAGNDLLWGDGGADLFVFGTGSGADTLHDFRPNEGDRLDLQGQRYTLIDTAAGCALALSGGGTVSIIGVEPHQFSADFLI